MNWNIIKEFRFSDNHISIRLEADFQLNSDTNIVGYQHFTEEQWLALWNLAGKPKLIAKTSYMIGDVISVFSVTTEMLEEVGIAFLVGKGNTKNWDTSTFIDDKNPNFNLMTVTEMLSAFDIA